MDNKITLLILAVFFIALPSLAQGTEHIVGDYHGRTFIVGDAKGWRSYFDYNNWAKGKVFRVGDVLLFKYSPGSHNVFKVDGPNFKACTSPANAEALTTGNDMITLATPGRKWYICGVSNHCQTGQKLFIDVLPSLKALAPPPPSVAVPDDFLLPSNCSFNLMLYSRNSGGVRSTGDVLERGVKK